MLSFAGRIDISHLVWPRHHAIIFFALRIGTHFFHEKITSLGEPILSILPSRVVAMLCHLGIRRLCAMLCECATHTGVFVCKTFSSS